MSPPKKDKQNEVQLNVQEFGNFKVRIKVYLSGSVSEESAKAVKEEFAKNLPILTQNQKLDLFSVIPTLKEIEKDQEPKEKSIFQLLLGAVESTPRGQPGKDIYNQLLINLIKIAPMISMGRFSSAPVLITNEDFQSLVNNGDLDILIALKEKNFLRHITSNVLQEALESKVTSLTKKENDLDTVKFLLSMGASPFKKDEYGKTPSQYAQADFKEFFKQHESARTKASFPASLLIMGGCVGAYFVYEALMKAHLGPINGIDEETTAIITAVMVAVVATAIAAGIGYGVYRGFRPSHDVQQPKLGAGQNTEIS